MLRVPLDELGYLEENREGLGIDPYHCHEVAWDASTNIVKLNRYIYADVVRVPPHRLDKFRKYNQDRIESNALMPKFSPRMCVGLATKTHFVHAMKLGAQGGRSLFNKGKIPISYKGEEYKAIIDQGVMCTVYSEEMLDDHEALKSVMGDDNLNSWIEMKEDEVQAFCRVHHCIKKMKD